MNTEILKKELQQIRSRLEKRHAELLDERINAMTEDQAAALMRDCYPQEPVVENKS